MTELNLVPEYLKERKTRLSQVRLRIIIIVGVFVILYFAFYIPGSLIEKLKEQEMEIKLKSDLKKSNIGDEILIKEDVNKLWNYINNVEKIKMNRTIVSDKIYNLQKYVPEDLKILNLMYNNGEIILSGSTVNYMSISNFAFNLQSIREFKSARITSIKYNQVNNSYFFNIKIIFSER